MFKRATLLLCLLLPVACASSGGATGRDSSRLTADEIQSVDVSTLYDVVQRLRPRWLDVRATTGFNGTDDIVVFQGQSLVGGTETLRQFTPESVRWMEYLDGPRASNTLPGLGSRRVEGAIVLHTTDPS
ncbi:MAG: hypothetical protein ACYC28_14910 [Longimicrobiales bacterium]